jgi:hypothetical protein
MFVKESIETNNNDLLEKKLVEEILVKPIPAQTNDVLVNLVIDVNFLKCFSPKSHITFQEPPLWLQYKELVRLFLCFFVFIFKLLVFLIILK